MLLLENFYIKIAFLNVHDGVLCTRLRCSGIFVGVMPLCELRILEIHSFPHFSLTCLTYLAEILHMTLFYCYYRSSSNFLNLRQFLWEFGT